MRSEWTERFLPPPTFVEAVTENARGLLVLELGVDQLALFEEGVAFVLQLHGAVHAVREGEGSACGCGRYGVWIMAVCARYACPLNESVCVLFFANMSVIMPWVGFEPDTGDVVLVKHGVLVEGGVLVEFLPHILHLSTFDLHRLLHKALQQGR